MSSKSVIVYDGECIFCQNYVSLFRLRDAIGSVELIDARTDDPRVDRLWKQGFDLNEGMVFQHRGQTFYGADAVHVLASLSSANGLTNRLNAAVFKYKSLTRLVYPALKLGRRLTLRVRGRTLLHAPRG